MQNSIPAATREIPTTAALLGAAVNTATATAATAATATAVAETAATSPAAKVGKPPGRLGRALLSLTYFSSRACVGIKNGLERKVRSVSLT